MASLSGNDLNLLYNDGGDSRYSFRRQIIHQDDSDEEERSASSSSDEDAEEFSTFDEMMRSVQQNGPLRTLAGNGRDERIQNMAALDWYWLGHDAGNSSYLRTVNLNQDALNGGRMLFFFRGLTRSSTIEEMNLDDNGLNVEGIRNMVPFLENANNLNYLSLGNNNISSEGFNILFRALRDSPIEYLLCTNCGIELIEINRNNIPQNLVYLCLDGNSINTDGCRGLATLLRGRDATLTRLWLSTNKIDDEGVAILVDALQNNASLKELDLSNNEGISVEGMKVCLRLVNDISSIKATVQSNHTLQKLTVKEIDYELLGLWSWLGMDGCNVNVQIQREIDNAVSINMMNTHSPERAGKEKVVQTQLHSGRRAELANLQGVDRSLYSEINPLHLPEVLALVGRIYGHGELHLALVSSIAILFTTVNKEECAKQQMEYHAAMTKEHESKFKAIQAELETVEQAKMESRSRKRPPTEEN